MRAPPVPSNSATQEAARLMLQGQWMAALHAARQGLLAAEHDPELWEIVGSCAHALQDPALSELAWTQVLAARPDALNALNNLGILLDAQQRYPEASEVYRQALALAPQDPQVLGNYGLLLEHTGQIEAAAQLQQQALALASTSPQILSNLAGVRVLQGRDVEAEQCYRQALAVNADVPDILCNLGILLTDQDRFEEAEPLLRRALAVDPTHIASQTSLAQLLLCQGCLSEGWRHFEARRTIAGLRDWFQADPQRASCRYWQGEALIGKTLLVLPEQGFGDEIQFSRNLQWLKAQGLQHLSLICRDELKSLFTGLRGPDQVLGLTEAAHHREHYDYWTVLMSLPRFTAGDLGPVPEQIPYLQAQTARISDWRPRLPNAGLRVGLVWRGNPAHSNDAERSFASIESLAPLWSLEGLCFVSLQTRDSGQAPSSFPGACVDLGPALRDFADTAAVLVQLDLLISVDTSVAHLAGALGVPCWLLLPAYKTDWRWQRKREDTPWYPAHRLFRQPRRGDWASVVTAVRAALAERLQGCSP
jgi:Flp pilus assembly protein TadD